jgi:short-subunit dehydrogenase
MTADRFDPAGLRVLVTGASSGIGAATAVAFTSAGATVALCARREDRLAEVLERCRRSSAGSCAIVADLSRLDELEAVAASAADRLGGIDVLVNNAGVPKRRRTDALTPADVEGVMALNYFSPVRLTLAVLPAMIEHGTGHVVNVSSMGAHMVSWGTAAYAATKSALELFTEAMYLELSALGVHAHLVVPGTTRTEFSTDRPGNDPPHPVDPATSAAPEEVAAAIVGCLATDEFVTYATARDAATAATKAADPNAFLARMRTALAAR